MKDTLRKILYGDIYETSPGSGRYQEQSRRIDVAIAFVEEEMAKKKKKETQFEEEKPVSSFRDKIIKKSEGEK